MNKDIRYGLFPISLILLVLLSMFLIAAPVSATTATPPSSSITVQQGGVFLLRGSITFDKAATGYFFYGPVYWYNYGNENENFTLENTPSVYWSDDNTPVENIAISDYVVPDGWQIDIADNGDGISRNGTFYIDIYLQAKGNGGTLHAPGHENIYFAADSITFFEPSPSSVSAGPIDVDVTALTRGVNVSITPSSQYGWASDNLVYNVKVQNTGEIAENFRLTLGDSAGWLHGWNAPSQVENSAIVIDNIHVPAGYSPENKSASAQIGVLDDAYVNENIPTGNWGRSYTMYIGAPSTLNTGNHRNDYLKFDLSSLPMGATITSAKLWLDVQYGPETTTFVPENAWIECWSVTNDNWKEGNYVLDNNGYARTAGDNIRWDNAPAVVSLLDNEYILGYPWQPNPYAANGKDNIWCTWSGTTFTNFVSSQWPSDNKVSFAIVYSNSTVPDNFVMQFYSKDNYFEYSVPPMTNTGHNGDFRPRLEVTYTNFPIENTVSLGPGENWTGQLWAVVSGSPGSIDNLPVTATSWDSAIENTATCQAHHAVAGVDVTISPLSKSGMGDTTFTVTVKNTGVDNLPDNYQLENSGTENWALFLENVVLGPIPVGENMTTTLHVYIENLPGTTDNVTVKATSVHDNTVSDNATCQAIVAVRGVQVAITPPSQENDNGGTLTYTVTVKNLDNVQENFKLEKGDNAGWTLTLDNTWLLIPSGENKVTKLTVNIPTSAIRGTFDSIWVKATSNDNTAVFDNKSCLAQVTLVRGVQVAITPPSQENDNGGTLTYTVTVKNLDNVQENFKLENGDNAGWTLTLDNTWLLIPSGENRVTKLTVNIPTSAIPGTFDSIWVKATSNDNTAVFDNKSCLAQVTLVRGVQVAITPPSQENDNGGTLTYTVTVKNLGNVQENFKLENGDNAGWTLTLDNAWLLIPSGENRTTKLTVNIPTSATGGTIDNIGVKATSNDNTMILDNKSCLANVKTTRGVQVVITPPTQDNDNGGTLTYTVTVKNLGNVQENFKLENGDNAGWTLTLDNTWLLITKGGTGTTKLTVNILASATGGTSDNIWVKATSNDNTMILDNKSCLANVKTTRGVQVVITPPTQDNDNGGTLTYTVTVKNLGNVQENFKLENGDNAGWTLTLDNTWLLITKGGTGTTKLTVNIPTSAIPGAFDNIWVKATSNDNTAVFDNKSCLAQVTPVRGVQVVISPASQENVNGGTLTYTVTVKNLGNVQENFQLTKGDSVGWTLSLDNAWLVVPIGENRTTKLTVNIPTSATGGTIDNIWVKAASKDNTTVFDNKSCLAQAKIVRGVQVVINPTPPNYLENENGGTVKFTVTVVNLSNVQENFLLTRGDNKGWTLTLDNSWLLVPKGESRVTHLNVTIPTNATDGTFDNIWVKATSKDDNTVFDNKACLAHVKIVTPTPPVVGVSVSISPSAASAAPGKGLSYTVTVNNTGSATDTFDLSISGGTGWSPSISPSSITLAASASGGASLTVTVPSGASEGASTTITVTATSRADPTVSSSKSCKATATAPGPGPNPTPTGISWAIILVIAGAIVIIVVILLIIIF